MQRRDFLKFVGRGAAAGAVLGGSSIMQSCIHIRKSSNSIPSLPATTVDDLVLAPGLTSQVLIRWQDQINLRNDIFGFNNDFIAVLPGENTNSAYMWVNHEYVNPLFVSGYNPEKNLGVRKTKEQVDVEQKNVGGSFFRIVKSENTWTVDKTSPRNFRVDATTPMKIISRRPIQQSMEAVGTTGNCCGGQTPWGTILTCEENFQDFYGSVRYSKKGSDWQRHVIASSHPMAWDDHTPFPPEHYGWVVEVNPRTRECRKLTALGRFAHEGALVVLANDGRPVVYMGDDSQDQFFYKFISNKPGSLDEGDLYVANLEHGKWEHLNSKNPKLKGQFKDQTDLLIRTREAAKLAGGTPLDRPEGCAQDPVSKDIFLNCTMNKRDGRPFGSIMKFSEQSKDPLSMHFSSEVFLNGGHETGFSCPDNMCFDSNGNMWMTSDIADYDLNEGDYKRFGNNSLFYIPLLGKNAGVAHRLISAPRDAEITGPCFSADGKTLFLSIQHPGGNTTDVDSPTSHWPDKGNSIPRPSVVAISGPLIERLTSLAP